MGCPLTKNKKEIVEEEEGKKEEETATPTEEGAEGKEALNEVNVDKDKEETKEETKEEDTKEEKEDGKEEKEDVTEQKEDAQEETEDKTEEEEKVIVVFGATGLQGGSVARAVLQNPKYKVKAVTRNPDSDKAKLLTKEGADVVTADLDDADSIKAVLEGAYGVFIVTNYWEYMDKDKEVKQGRAVADACKEAGVKHVVYSGLDSAKQLSDIEVGHFDGKAEVEQYMQESGLPFTSVRYSCYYENFLTGLKPTKGEDENYVLNIPMADKELDIINAGGAGECVHQIFNNPDNYTGKILGLSSDKKTVSEIAETMTKVLGDKTVVAGEMTTAQMSEAEFPGAKEMAAMFEFYQTGKCERSVEGTKKLHPNIPDLATWLDDNKDAFRAALE